MQPASQSISRAWAMTCGCLSLLVSQAAAHHTTLPSHHTCHTYNTALHAHAHAHGTKPTHTPYPFHAPASNDSTYSIAWWDRTWSCTLSAHHGTHPRRWSAPASDSIHRNHPLGHGARFFVHATRHPAGGRPRAGPRSAAPRHCARDHRSRTIRLPAAGPRRRRPVPGRTRAGAGHGLRVMRAHSQFE